MRLDLELTDYQLRVGSDQFNEEIKSSSNGRFIESSVYAIEREKKGSRFIGQRLKNDQVAVQAFNQSTIVKGYEQCWKV